MSAATDVQNAHTYPMEPGQFVGMDQSHELYRSIPKGAKEAAPRPERPMLSDGKGGALASPIYPLYDPRGCLYRSLPLVNRMVSALIAAVAGMVFLSALGMNPLASYVYSWFFLTSFGPKVYYDIKCHAIFKYGVRWTLIFAFTGLIGTSAIATLASYYLM